MSVLYVRDENGKFVKLPAISGKSAYEIAVERGMFNGTEQEFAESQIINNKDIIDQITQENIDSWNNAKGMTDEEKEQLSNKIDKVEITNDNYLIFYSNDIEKSRIELPTVGGENISEEQLEKIVIAYEHSQTEHVQKEDIPTKTSELINDSNFLTEISSEYITETELNAKGYLTEHQDISGKADKTELHNHTNKTVLDEITNTKVTEWDNKSTFSGDYNDLTNKPSIPSIEGLATEEYVAEFFGNIINNVNVGYVDTNEDNAIGITDIPQGNYTLRYKNGSTVLSNYYDIGTVEDGKIFNRDFIKENIPPYESTRIGVYDGDGEEVGGIPLYYFKKERGERLYSFGMLSDVHNQTDQAAEPTADLQRALSLFNEREDVEFTCISGDITQTATEEEYQIFSNNIQACSPNTPVYSTPGNHDCYGSGLDLELWTQYTGCDRTYEITHGNDHFLFLGMNQWSMGTSSCTPYLMEDLEWLAEKLEVYRNERCFIFTHLFFPEYAGNLKEIYPPGNWLMGTQHDFLKDLLNRYTNTIWFSGHSHWKWYLQKYQDNANIERAGGWTVHIPSCANPIDSDGVSTRVGKGLESEGAIIDVYEDYIDIRGIDLKNDMYIPIAKYRLDTTLVEITNDTDTTLAYTLPEGSELYLNQRYSASGGGLVDADGTIVVIVPLTDTSTLYTLKMENLPYLITGDDHSTLYAVDTSTMTSLGTPAGVNHFSSMSSDVLTINDDGSLVEVICTPISGMTHLAVTLRIDSSSKVLTEDDLAGIVISLEKNA